MNAVSEQSIASVRDRLVRSREPLYLQIHYLIADKIRDGELKPGDRLPPDQQLAGYRHL